MMNFSNLYGFSLKLSILAMMKARQEKGERNTIKDLLNSLIEQEQATGKITKEQRAQLRQRIYVFLENSTASGEVVRTIEIDQRQRAEVVYLLGEKSKIR